LAHSSIAASSRIQETPPSFTASTPKRVVRYLLAHLRLSGSYAKRLTLLQTPVPCDRVIACAMLSR
jgi:hypothetical protein